MYVLYAEVIHQEQKGGIELRGKGQLRGMMGGRGEERSSRTACNSIHSVCESAYHIPVSLSIILLQLQNRVRKSSALIKPYVLLTKQEKKKNRMRISALPPTSPTTNLSLAFTAASPLADRSWQ